MDVRKLLGTVVLGTLVMLTSPILTAHSQDMTPRGQSPVALPSTTVGARTAPITFKYHPSTVTVTRKDHNVSVSFGADVRNTIQVDGITYTLREFHFHNPSEHSLAARSGIELKGYPDLKGHTEMEVHLVHRHITDPAKPDEGDIAVIGRLITVWKNISPKSEALKPIWDALGNFKTGEPKTVTVQNFNPMTLIPNNRFTYRYSGSLTSDPYPEGLKWIVFPTLLEVDQSQIDDYTKAYKPYRRNIQPLNGRTVFPYN